MIGVELRSGIARLADLGHGLDRCPLPVRTDLHPLGRRWFPVDGLARAGLARLKQRPAE